MKNLNYKRLQFYFKKISNNLKMSQLRASKCFYIKAYTIPIYSLKSVYFNRLKNKFPSILLTQTVEELNSDHWLHHIAIQTEKRVSFLN